MSDVLTQRERKDRLFTWREMMAKGGVPAEELPLPSDLDIVARRQVQSEDELSQFLLTRKQLVLDWADHLLWVVNASPSDEQVVPPWAKPAGVAQPGEREAANGSPSNGSGPTPRQPKAADLRINKVGQSAAAEAEPTEQYLFAATDPMSRFAPAANQISFRLEPSGVQVAWPRHTDANAIRYRVTSRANYRPVMPERSDPVGVSEDPQLHDVRGVDTAIRHYAVWTYSAPELAGTSTVQPELWAEGAMIAPPQGVLIQERDGQVMGGWHCLPGIEEVAVFRIPVAEVGDDDSYPIEYQICVGADNLTGFVDSDVPAGGTYEYRFAAIAEDAQQSPFVVQQISVLGTLHPVRDLRIDDRPDGVFLSWSQPALGQCQVFQTDRAPAAGPDDLLDVQALPQAGLSLERRLPMPAYTVDGRLTVGPIKDPNDWARTHYTVVVVDHSRAVVGTPVVRARATRIDDAVIHERVDHQLIVFDWPGQAVNVNVFVTAPGSPYHPSFDQHPHASMSRQEFERRGGLVLGDGMGGSSRALRAPCRVWLVPMTFEAGQAVATDPFAVEYPGLVRIDYRFDIQRAGRGGKQQRVTLSMRSELQALAPLAIAVVWQEGRLPLRPADGYVLGQARMVLTQEVQHVLEIERLPDRPGYARVFVAQPPNAPRIAVLDPPLESLMLP